MKLRGSVFVACSIILSLATFLLLIFVHVGSVSTASVPRGIYMASVNTSGYGDALYNALFDPIGGLYADDSSDPLREHQGIREVYKFGLYSHCGYMNATSGICSNHTFSYRFTPYPIITDDMSSNYSAITDALVLDSPFRDSDSLGASSKAAYWMIFLGTITSFVALCSTVIRRGWAHTLSTVAAIVSTILILIGASVWTALIHKSQALNHIYVGNSASPTPLGPVLSTGTGVYLLWAAFACSIASVVPYMITCCTYRG